MTPLFKKALILPLLFQVIFAFAHQPEPAKRLRFVKNLNQFHPDVLYSAEMPGGAIYLEQASLMYVFYNAEDLEKIDDYVHHGGDNLTLKGHAYRVSFDDAMMQCNMKEEDVFLEYHNYFLGNDPAKWAGHVPLFGAVTYEKLYPGIDLKVFSENGNLKYDLILLAGADPKMIMMNFDGADGLSIEKGRLKITTSVGDIYEDQPRAYQLIDGRKTEVACRFALNNGKVSFAFPEGYSSRHDLVIDPAIIASTYSGNTYRAYGHTATYDDAGNIYLGGKAFSVNANGSGAGYPVTTGAFQINHAGGYQDIGIIKYNPDGSQLLWATYLGGGAINSRGGQDSPHSLFANANGELYVYGSSNSRNYPVTANAYDPVFETDSFGNYLSDIVVTRLAADGSALIGSTYVGGKTENDGDNATDMLRYYGDHYKGEIIVDENGNAYVASYAQSRDFPTTASAFQRTYGGGEQDGVIFKLNSDLSNLEWSTFLGGPLADACYALKLDKNGNLFVTGAVSGNFLPNTSGSVNPDYIGGDYDAFIAHIASDGASVYKSTYFGSTGEEQAYLLDLDNHGNVFIFGSGPDRSVQPTPGAYRGVLSGAFIAKLPPSLDAINFVTTFNELAPTALMVDQCNQIYAVGHGGLNTSAGTMENCEITPDAFQTGSGGFYILVLDSSATTLKFGSYYGPPESHVDGGTCRFDKRGGVIYHALCTNKPTFYTTPWAHQPTNLSVDPSSGNSMDYDNCVFKIDFFAAKLTAQAEATVTINDTSSHVEGCAPLAVQFINGSQNAMEYLWNFGNGDTSSSSEPAYTFADTGFYNVMLVAINPNACNPYDTSYVTVLVRKPVAAFSYNPDFPTPGNDISFTNESINANTYLWEFGDDDTSSAVNPTHAYADTGVYVVCLTSVLQPGCFDSVCRPLKLNNFAADIPNAFTPNDDRLNDVLFVKGQGVRTLDFRIYNRWGQLVFESDDMAKGWDGKYKDEPQEMDAYGYYLKAIFNNDEFVEKQGNVTLIR